MYVLVQCLTARGCLKSWLLFRHPREFKIKSLYSNDLILNIASKSKETVQKLKFFDSPIASADRMSVVLHSIEFFIRKTRSSQMYKDVHL